MDTLKQRPALVTALVLLLIAKFVIVPVLDWQKTLLNSIALTNKQVEKHKQLLKNKESYSMLLENVNEELQRGELLLYPASDINRFQIKQQKEIEAFFEKNNIEIRSFNWDMPIAMDDFGLLKVVAKLNVSGEGRALASLPRALSARDKWWHFEEFNYRFDDNNRTRQEAIPNILGRLELALYMENGSDTE